MKLHTNTYITKKYLSRIIFQMRKSKYAYVDNKFLLYNNSKSKIESYKQNQQIHKQTK